MENFIVSARKYRPVTFNEVVGQKAITNTLKNAIKNNHLAQAFLFTGPRGVGKTTCARVFAKTINCMNLTEDIEPCNECESCKSFNSSSSFNVHELDAASNNSVEDIRRLVEQVRIPPQVGNYKIYIIDEVHMLSQAAFNAFLKTLEEPPAYAKFILATTEKHKIIPTILSRCQIYDFNRITSADIAEHLKFVAKSENIEAEDDALHIIATKADGALRDALSIFDQMVSFSGNKITYESAIENLNVLHTEYYFKLIEHLLKGDITSTLLLYDEVISKGFEGQHFIFGVAEHLRNLMVVKDAATVQLLEVAENMKQRFLEQSRFCSIHFIIEALKIINFADINYKIVVDKRIFMELNLMKLCQLSGNMKEVAIEKLEPTKPTTERKEPVFTPKPEVKKKEEKKPEAQKETQQKPKPSVLPQSRDEKSSTPKVSKPEPAKTQEQHQVAKAGNFGMSIKQNLDEAKDELHKSKQKIEEEEKDFSGTPDVVIDAEQLKQAVIDFASTIEEKEKAFSVALNSKRINIPRPNEVHIVFTNTAINNPELKLELKDYLKAKFDNQQIKISTEIIEEEVAHKNEPLERYNKMAKKNPEVDNLRNQLGLNF
jgi:DNA polymerase-3 subunit gamma/tau